MLNNNTDFRLGDLVLVGPDYQGAPSIIVDTEARDKAGHLQDCVTIHVPHNGYTIPMNKKWLKVISESR